MYMGIIISRERKYMGFLSALHKSSKWELFVVPYNIWRLDINEGKNAFTVVGQ